MKTNDKSLDLWLNFFAGKKDFAQFIALLEKTDKTFLSYENNLDHEHPLFDKIPRRGFLEEDFLRVLKGMDADGINSIDEKTRLVLAMSKGANFKQWKDVYKQDLELVFAKSLIDGKYEEYGVDLEKIIALAIQTEVIDKFEFIGIAVIRGALLADRYPSEEAQHQLEKKVKANKRKVLLQSFLIRI